MPGVNRYDLRNKMRCSLHNTFDILINLCLSRVLIVELCFNQLVWQVLILVLCGGVGGWEVVITFHFVTPTVKFVEYLIRVFFFESVFAVDFHVRWPHSSTTTRWKWQKCSWWTRTTSSAWKPPASTGMVTAVKCARWGSVPTATASFRPVGSRSSCGAGQTQSWLPPPHFHSAIPSLVHF